MAVGSNRHFPVLSHYVSYYSGFLRLFEQFRQAAVFAQKSGLLPKEVVFAVVEGKPEFDVQLNQLEVRFRLDWLHNPPLGRVRSALILDAGPGGRRIELDMWTFDLHGNVFEKGQEQQTSLYSLSEPGDAAELLSRTLIAAQSRFESDS